MLQLQAEDGSQGRDQGGRREGDLRGLWASLEEERPAWCQRGPVPHAWELPAPIVSGASAGSNCGLSGIPPGGQVGGRNHLPTREMEEVNLLASAGEAAGGGAAARGLRRCQVGSESPRTHPSSRTLASPSGPRTGLSGVSAAFVFVPSALPLPWRRGHKSHLPLLHRGTVIYARPAGIVNFFLMFKICHS